KARYDFDQARVAPYFELDRVLEDGVFYAAHQLYGLSFKERRDLPVCQADVRVFEVFDAAGAPHALFLADYFARDNKQGGAWMASYVSQSQLLHHKPVVANHLNIPKPQPGQPVLLTFDEVTTMFHEFGHALHGMLSSVRYPKLSGTAVPRDFVEYPSQYNEMWAREPEVVAHYAGGHALVPGVRPRAAGQALGGALPDAPGHGGAAGLRRLPPPVQRVGGGRAGGGGALRPPLSDGRADAAGAARESAGGAE